MPVSHRKEDTGFGEESSQLLTVEEPTVVSLHRLHHHFQFQLTCVSVLSPTVPPVCSAPARVPASPRVDEREPVSGAGAVRLHGNTGGSGKGGHHARGSGQSPAGAAGGPAGPQARRGGFRKEGFQQVSTDTFSQSQGAQTPPHTQGPVTLSPVPVLLPSGPGTTCTAS